MDEKKFRRCAMIVGAFVGASVGWSVATGNAVLVIIAVIIGLTFEHLCRRRVTDVIEDERIYRISEKASRRTFQVFIVIFGVIGAVLIALSKSGYGEFRQAGFTLALSVCALIISYLTFYGYYSRKGLD